MAWQSPVYCAALLMLWPLKRPPSSNLGATAYCPNLGKLNRYKHRSDTTAIGGSIPLPRTAGLAPASTRLVQWRRHRPTKPGIRVRLPKWVRE